MNRLREPRPAQHLSLATRASEDLRLIRQTMERAASFTALPGWGGVLMGVVALGAAPLAQAATTRQAWLGIWLGAALLALPGTCSANTGSCMAPDASTVTWTGTLNPGQTVTINFQAQIADGTPAGTQVCANSVVTVGAITVGGVRACATVNCQATGPGAPPPATSPVSEIGRASCRERV